MDIGLYSYKRSRGIIKHKTAVPFYPAPATTAPAQAGGKLANPAATPWPAPPAAPPPSSAIAVEVIGNVSGGAPTVPGDDVDRRAALFISRVQERLRRERANEDWRKYY